MAKSRPLYSFRMNGKLFNSSMVNAEKEGEKYSQLFEKGLGVTFQNVRIHLQEDGMRIIFENRSGNDTITISNIVPFGEDNNSVYITGKGPWDLARAWLFSPELQASKGYTA